MYFFIQRQIQILSNTDLESERGIKVDLLNVLLS